MQRTYISRFVMILSLLVAFATLAPIGHADAAVESSTPAPPATLVSDIEIGSRLHELTMDSPAMGGKIKARLLVPIGWEQDPDRPRPVLYLLHGANGNEGSWTSKPGLQEILAPYDVLVIMPDGGEAGFYSDWYNNGSGGAPAYETHHLVELRHILEEDYHANGRYAVAGASMGGLGTMSYAARHPDMFVAAASISGALDTGLADPLGIQSLAGVSGVAAPIDLTSVWGPKGAGEVR
ncbi:MAG: prolyl oligopeptidase family serine peptidase, partial [Actinobacteria bacterium]|nr:prolyl oligopeptidase family serine peptidase [Actinomycetota bacterium]